MGHSPRSGEIHGLDELVGFMRRAEVEGQHTQHLTTDLLVDVNGDRAAASANSLVYFYRDGQAPHLTSGLRLACTAVRTQAGWRIRETRDGRLDAGEVTFPAKDPDGRAGGGVPAGKPARRCQ